MFKKIKNTPYWKNSEFHQAVVRMLIGLGIIIHIGIGMKTSYYPSHFIEYKIFATSFILYSTLAMFSVIFFPNLVCRRYITTTLDIFSICYSMLITEAGPFSAYFLIYPWMFISNGLRYGKASLSYTTIIGILSFILILILTDTWYSQYLDALAYLLFLFVLPIYINIMLNRENAGRAEKEQILKSRNEFLTTLSHEIRTPMSGIIGMTTLLDRSELNKEQQEYVTSLHELSSTLHSLINSVLDLSKLEAKKAKLDLQPGKLSEIINSAIRVFIPRANTKTIKLECQLKTLPHRVMVDSHRLRQILLNLVSNAVEFTQAGSIVVKVNGEQKDKNNWIVRFEIIDTGPGIENKHLRHIFEPFYQCTQTYDPVPRGTGLGTTICKELVELMGGEIGVTTSYGQGSTFWFKLPLETTDNNLASTQPLPRNNTSEKSQKLNILLAEDNLIVAKVITSFLEIEGHTINVVISGDAALHELTKNKYDMVFMDMKMPGSNGTEVTKKWRLLEPENTHIPIIALTANSSPEDHHLCLASGMDGFLVKPVSPEQLVYIIQSYFKR